MVMRYKKYTTKTLLNRNVRGYNDKMDLINIAKPITSQEFNKDNRGGSITAWADGTFEALQKAILHFEGTKQNLPFEAFEYLGNGKKEEQLRKMVLRAFKGLGISEKNTNGNLRAKIDKTAQLLKIDCE